MSNFFALSQKNLIAGCLASAVALAFTVAPVIGAEKTLYAFRGGNYGTYPWASLTADSAGNLYGTTYDGGSCNYSSGCGIVFRLSPKGRETVLHTFTSGSDGGFPKGGLIMDKGGNIYGTAAAGGSCGFGNGCGVVFKMTPSGKETVLYTFQGGEDGIGPTGNLAMDDAGDLYGTTGAGGGNLANCQYGCGTVFELAPDGTETVLYAFQGGSDGSWPMGGVARDASGNLYGTTLWGGGSPSCTFGCGTVFKISGDDGTYSILHAFQGYPDGALPYGGVIVDSSGNLFGTTSGPGTVFKLAPDGTETVLHAFGSGKDGSLPEAGVIMDKSENLYGTTWGGGGVDCKRDIGCGTVFEMAANGQEKVLYAFGNNARHPGAGLFLGKYGELYGTTTGGGHHDNGVVFELKKQLGQIVLW
ncbi:MAG TPA: choice-of-anchor tandem repeat GloVer-containing protein [Rhizomicrobium sp.]|jgi:uncharacterized repeat protein (TIGR03803 family)|nr:choice-of-anchor tandem repeat GloVer-containing protein [Rhizomicrobium sp.]